MFSGGIEKTSDMMSYWYDKNASWIPLSSLSIIATAALG